MKRFGICASLALASLLSFANLASKAADSYDELPPWYVSIGGGAILFEGDEATKNSWFPQIKLGYDVNEMFSFEGSALVMPDLKRNDVYDYDTGVPVMRPGLDGDKTVAVGGAVDALFHLNWSENRHFDPYLIGGVGILGFDKDRQFRNRIDETIRYGMGIAWHFNEEWTVRADMIGHMTVDKQEFNWMPQAGINWRWGTKIPKKFAVAGGALDTDGDGLSDEEELRLGTDPKNPDTDGDKLLDGEEVKVYKTDPLNLDTDYDGLNDGREVYETQTNPLDRDTDKGGVADGHEVIDDFTNPLDGSDDLMLFTLNIEFDTDKADIKSIYFADLDKIGKVLSRDPKSTARIEGHADKRKTSVADHNVKLSERRAAAILDYLNKHFNIARDRMKPWGYGFARPLALNDPITGNVKNRRTEIYIRKGDQQPGAAKPAVAPVPTAANTPAPAQPVVTVPDPTAPAAAVPSAQPQSGSTTPAPTPVDGK